MNYKTRQMIQEIKNKYKNRITRESEFKKDEQVIDLAIQTLHEQMKKERLI
tara:strand:- start:854 stop:1006 length:153 start_codon:yes stop_codon:yes gene_type:complete